MAASGSAGGGGEGVAEGVSFDGVSDYLSRSSDLVGNVDSKTFTFSCWVYIQDWDSANIIYGAEQDATYRSRVYLNVVGLNVDFENSAGVRVFRVSGVTPPKQTFIHILFSVDLTNTANRYLYVNDVLTIPVWNTYTNDSVNFTTTKHQIGAQYDFTNKIHGRLSNLFLDHTYRDLSIESNRRLFITADGKPADQSSLAALNPILYLPMTDSDTAGVNLGTGGDFTVNGVLDDAQRGPNQWNCVASEFDGVNDSLRSTLVGAANGKVLTLSLNVTRESTTGSRYIHFQKSGGFLLTVYCDNGQTFLEITEAATGLPAVKFYLSTPIPLNVSTHVSMYINTDSEAGSGVYINGIKDANAFNTFLTGATMQLSMDSYTFMAQDTSSFVNGSIGEIYFDTTYTDLAADNPFWDFTLKKPKPVRQVLEETGNTPLIAMPISADNPGKNYGTGGDFTLYG